jgi:iron complex transport system substrate-binding protein
MQISRFRIKIFTVGCILVLLFLNTGCVQQGTTIQENAVKITDMLGRVVAIPENIDNVVGIEAGSLRLLVYLQCTDMVVGIEDIELDGGKPYNFAHPELTELPLIGPIHGGDQELIMKQGPDIIFWTYTTVGEADELQEKTGIPVVALIYGDLDDNLNVLFESLRLMGSILNKEDRAEELIEYINTVITDLTNRTINISNDQKLKTYVGGISSRGAHGILSTEPAYAPFLFVNSKNVASELGMEHAFIDKEKLIEWDPEVIFIDEGGYSLTVEDLKDNSYQSIDAIKDDNIYGVLPYNYYTTNFGTVLANSYYIGSILFPDEFKDIIPEEKADDIYQKFVGKCVYEDMKALYGGFNSFELNDID